MSSQGPELRIGDAEREAAVTALGEHYAAGRLTKEEFDERSSRAWEARTSSAMWPLFADLPRTDTRSAARDAPPHGRRHGAGRPWWVVLFVPVLMFLVVLTVITHLPIVLLAVVVWLLWARRHGMRRRYFG
jgi:hypothetical protein